MPLVFVMKEKSIVLSAFILALGIVWAGMSIGRSVRHFADKDRSVTVKGLSTRDVMADHAVWPMYYSVQGNDLPTVYTEISRLQEQIADFLVEQGFAKNDIQFGSVDVTNNYDNYYGGRQPEFRYKLRSRVVISTDSVDLVRRSQGCESRLLARGIVLESSDWGLDYQYNGLPELKPEMIEEATKNARAVAQKFADDANCDLGSIRRANQGQFSVESDGNCPWIKHVRVVTTLDYYLR